MDNYFRGVFFARGYQCGFLKKKKEWHFCLVKKTQNLRSSGLVLTLVLNSSCRSRSLRPCSSFILSSSRCWMLRSSSFLSLDTSSSCRVKTTHFTDLFTYRHFTELFIHTSLYSRVKPANLLSYSPIHYVIRHRKTHQLTFTVTPSLHFLGGGGGYLFPVSRTHKKHE